MPRFLLVSAALFAVLLSACSQAPQPPATATEAAPAADETATHRFEPAIRAADLAEHVAILASDAFEGRGPGGRGERLTTEYLVAQFQRIGLEPGNDGDWFQAVPMVEINAAPGIGFEVSGSSETPIALAFGRDVVIGSPQLRERIFVEDSPMVFAGYGIVAPEFGWNDYAGLDVTGKTVVVLVNDPGFATQDPALFRGNAMTYYGRWTYKFEEAARQGAAGVLIVHETRAASYGWEVVQNSWGGAQFDLVPGDNAPPRLEFEGWISGEAAERLFAAEGLDYGQLAQAAARPGFRAVELAGRATVHIENRIRTARSNNVLGLLRGHEAPDEVVVYMAHWDHLGRSFGGPRGPEIYNGAVDNASGVAGLLEIAEAFANGARPRRSVLFIALTLEESGLLGSRHYVENPVFPLERTVAAINMDALSVIGPTHDVVVIGYGNSELEDLLKAAAAGQQRVVVPEPTPENGFYYRSDHFNFAKAGVPALYAKGGYDHREFGIDYGRAAAAAYVAERYHKPTDVFDDSWDLSGTVEDLELLYQVGRELADGKAWPNWYPGTEFRAARDAMRAAR